MALKSFRNRATEDINYGLSSKQARRVLPSELHLKAQMKLARIGAATNLRDLQELKGNKLEALKGDRRGQYSIRINDQYRICFQLTGQDALEVEIVDYHD